MYPAIAIGSKEIGDSVELRSQSVRRWFLLPLFLFVFGALSVKAQTYLGNLTGQVSDSTGAKVAGAIVTATDTTTHFSTKATTNSGGSYSIQFLTPDTYNISVEHPGFRTQASTGVVLTAAGSVETDFTLSIGSSSETVTVNAAAGDLINTDSADLGTTLTAKEVTDLPNLGRVPFFLASITAGNYSSAYILGGSAGNEPGGNDGTGIISNGVGSQRTLITLNGLLDNPSERISGSGGNTYGGFAPSPESVQEVSVQSATYDAWSSGQTVINTVLRSGTNEYHGAAYYVFRNTYLNANQYQRVPNQNGATNPKAPTPRVNGTWNQPGVVFDGPVRIPHLYDGRDKTYFMAAYEEFNLHVFTTAGATDFVPTAAEAGGDFSALCTGGFNASGVCSPGGGIQIYDPLNVAANGNRAPFPNNQIPSNRISPVGAALASYYPAPNSNFSSTVNYLAANPTYPERYYSFVTRVDQSINENDKFNAVYYKTTFHQTWPTAGFPKIIGPGTGERVYRNSEGGSFDYVSVLPHQWVLDARVGVIYHPFGVIYPGDPFDLSSIGISGAGLGYQSFPGISMSDNYTGLQAASASQISTDTLGSAAAIVSKVIGKHNISFGFEGSLNRYNGESPLSGLGTFAFNRQFTQENSTNEPGVNGVGGPCPTPACTVGNDSTSGNPLASMLLGYPSSGTYATQVSFAIQQLDPTLFFQDNWRASQKLVLDMNLRWDDAFPYTERFNRLNTGFCTTCTNPLQNTVPGLILLGGLQFASPSNRSYYKNQLNHIQPRFGASYALTPRIVVHGGVGLTYLNSLESPLASGFSTTTNYVATIDNTHPITSFANPFPAGVNQPSGSSLGLATLVGQGFSFIAPNYVQPRELFWTASTQTALPANMVLQIAYVGNRVWDWENSKNINALPAQYYTGTAANVTYLQSTVPNPMAGQIPTDATINGPTIQRQYLFLPYPEFGALTEVYIPSGGDLYNSLQVTLTKRMGHGLSVMGNFTWAHEMDSDLYMNPTDPNPERYEDPQPNLLSNLALIYMLPHFSSLPSYERSVIGGWQFNSVFRAYNGLLQNNVANVTQLSDPTQNLSSGAITTGTNVSVDRFNTCYENAAGTLQITGTGPGQISTPACRNSSSIPAFRQNNTFTLNTLGPYMKDSRWSGGTRFDVSLFKVIPIHEKTTFEIRGEFFNVLNKPVFWNPGLTPGNATYGVVTLTQENDPRIGQLTARLNF